jgi:glycyl-tRNA synthetase beta chain
MTTAPLLIELLTEELPPKSLRQLATAFAAGVEEALRRKGLASATSAATVFATPRRLGVRVIGVHAQAADQPFEDKGPYVNASLDASGKPTAALLGFMKKKGIDSIDRLVRVADARGERFAWRTVVEGAKLDQCLASEVAEALKKLPIPKLMRWGAGDEQFVRPVHGLVMLHGGNVVPGQVLGIESGRKTRGHRFQGASEIVIEHADRYERQLHEEGRVIASFEERRAEIERQLNALARELDAHLYDPADLLDEVTALVEYPTVYAGRFDAEFLSVPQECLILTMRANQKYFPLLDRSGNLLPRFLIVSNMRLADPANIVNGNQRVVRPRLADARFFYEQDRKLSLESRLPDLERMVYHNKLGTQRERVERLRALAAHVAAKLDVDLMVVDRAALLCKADLATAMVGEFPELQGVMGRYYALNDGHPEAVGRAIEQHYRPRFAADMLPDRGAPAVLALADKLDILVGIYGIGLVPTGDRDPFALRRHALGVLRILVEYELPLALFELLAAARAGFGTRVELSADVALGLVGFILDRAGGYFREQGYGAEEIESVLDLYRNGDLPMNQLRPRLAAIREFRALPEAASLIEANKRSRNILTKEKVAELSHPVDAAVLTEASERTLHDAMVGITPVVERHVAQREFAAALRALARLRDHVDRFFNEVRVVVPDDAVRTNRFALLLELNTLLNRVANISRL